MEIQKTHGSLLGSDFESMEDYNKTHSTLKCQCRFSVSSDNEISEDNALCALAAKAAHTRVVCVIFDFSGLKDTTDKPFTEATAAATLATMIGQTLPLSIGIVSIAKDLNEPCEYTAIIGGKSQPVYTLQRVEIGHNMAETGLLEWAENTLKRRIAAGTLTKVELSALKRRREFFSLPFLYQITFPVELTAINILRFHNSPNAGIKI